MVTADCPHSHVLSVSPVHMVTADCPHSHVLSVSPVHSILTLQGAAGFAVVPAYIATHYQKKLSSQEVPHCVII
jgi:hypothetical protein